MSYRKQLKQRNLIKILATVSFIAASILTPNANELLIGGAPLTPLAPLLLCIVLVFLLLTQSRR